MKQGLTERCEHLISSGKFGEVFQQITEPCFGSPSYSIVVGGRQGS